MNIFAQCGESPNARSTLVKLSFLIFFYRSFHKKISALMKFITYLFTNNSPLDRRMNANFSSELLVFA